MTIQEISTKFDSVLRDLTGESLGNIMAKIGNSALYKINTRITKTGIDAEGSPYRPYSIDPMLSGCSNWLDKSKCAAYVGSKTKQRKERKKSAYEKYLSGEAGEFELKWVTLKRGGKNIRLYEIPGGYKEFRNLNDLQSGFVDFAFSNRMWRSIGIISSQTEQNYGTVIIGVIPGGDSELSKKKLGGNAKRRTSILKLSRGEVTDLTKEFDTEIEKILVKNGLQ